MKRITAVLLPALLVACNDGPTGPEPVREIEILMGGQPLQEEPVIAVGSTLQLSASTMDAEGNALTDRQIEWRSTAPQFASVDSTGLVRGLAEGSTLIIARADQAADTVRISVVVPPPMEGEVVCAQGDNGLELAVGQVLTLTARDFGVLCLRGGAEYAYIPFNGSSSPATVQLEVAAGGITGVEGPPLPSLHPAEGGIPLRTISREPRQSDDFHRRLRERERRELTPLIRFGSGEWSSSQHPAESQLARAVPAEGDLLRFNVNALKGCSDPDYHTGRVVAVTQRAIVVADTANPSGGFTQDEYRAFGVTFDTLVYPVVTRNFGEPTDIDENQRAIILFTRAVNELTKEGATSVTAGFFFGRDLFPKTGNADFQGCEGSNFAEMFYMMTPDPNGEVNGVRRSKSSVGEQTVAVLAHEFQHLINASRRLRIIKTSNWQEVTWLNEGMSHIAEELVFYGATPLQPREDITVERLRGTGSIDKFNEYQGDNLSRYISYLKDPENQSLIGQADDDDLETRGATWAFLRYAADRHNSDEPQLWKSLVDSQQTGVENLANALNTDPIQWMQDWTVAVYTDNTGLGTPTRFQQPSWDFRNLIGALRTSSGQQVYTTFPLKVISLAQRTNDNPVRLQLSGGGAAFLRFGVSSESKAAIRTTSNGLSPQETVKLSIVRTR